MEDEKKIDQAPSLIDAQFLSHLLSLPEEERKQLAQSTIDDLEEERRKFGETGKVTQEHAELAKKYLMVLVAYSDDPSEALTKIALSFEKDLEKSRELRAKLEKERQGIIKRLEEIKKPPEEA